LRRLNVLAKCYNELTEVLKVLLKGMPSSTLAIAQEAV